MNELLNTIEKLLSEIDSKTIKVFEDNIDLFTHDAYEKYEQTDELNALTNNCPLEFIEPLIEHHCNFFSEAFKINNSKVVFDHLIWEFSTYHKLGLPFNFFRSLFSVYITILEEKKFLHDFTMIINFYEYLLENFDHLISSAKSFKHQEILPANYQEIHKEFINALLTPNMTEAIEISNKFIQSKGDVKLFWEYIILPSMYNLGIKWSNGLISVGQEHTATSICQRVMSLHYDKILDHDFDAKKVIVTTSPKEMHQIGARMVADLLEMNNFDVYYIGSDSTIEDIVQTIINEDICDIVISTTLVANIDSTKYLIENIKQMVPDKNLIFYAGGQAYNASLNPVELIGVNYYVADVEELLKLLRENDHDTNK